MILVDSSVWIASFNGKRSVAGARLDDLLDGHERLCVVDLVITEVLQGFRSERDFELARRAQSCIDSRARLLTGDADFDAIARHSRLVLLR